MRFEVGFETWDMRVQLTCLPFLVKLFERFDAACFVLS